MDITMGVGDRRTVVTLYYERQYLDETFGTPAKQNVTIPFTDQEIGTQGPGEFGKWIFERLNTIQPDKILIDDKPVNLDRDAIASACEAAVRKS